MNRQLAVLLIEDDPAAAGLVAVRMGDKKAHITHVETLAAARRALERQRFDAILLDLQLPDGSGLDLLAQVRDLAPEMPIVVLTGNQDAQLSLHAVQQGAQDYLTKSEMDEYPPLLNRALRYAIERQRILMIAAQVEDLRERERQLRQLNEMGELLQVSLDAGEAHRIIARAGAALFSDAVEVGGGVGILSASGEVEIVAAWGDFGCEDQSFGPDECWALRRGRAHLALDGDVAELPCRHHGPSNLPSLCVPLAAQGELLGVLCLVACSNTPAGAARLRQVAPLATTFAEHIALALANLRLREKLQSQAIRDPLTGLLNRRYMEETLAREINRAQRAGEPLGVLMMDLDLFKAYNDGHGHVAGDRLLSNVGRLLGAHSRASDIACRYGGDEFLLILPSAAPETVRERAQQIRHGMRALPTESPVTLSLGAASFPDDGRTAAALLLAADAALYAAKRSGRDALRSSAA